MRDVATVFHRKNCISGARVRQPDDWHTRSKSMKIHFLAKEVKGPAACIPLRTFKTGFNESRGGRAGEAYWRASNLNRGKSAPVCAADPARLFPRGVERTRSRLLRFRTYAPEILLTIIDVLAILEGF